MKSFMCSLQYLLSVLMSEQFHFHPCLCTQQALGTCLAYCRILESRPWFGRLQAWCSPFWTWRLMVCELTRIPWQLCMAFSKAGWVSWLRDWRFRKTVNEPSYCSHGRFLVTALLSVLQFRSTYIPEEAEWRKLCCDELMTRRGPQWLLQRTECTIEAKKTGQSASAAECTDPNLSALGSAASPESGNIPQNEQVGLSTLQTSFRDSGNLGWHE